MNHWMASAGASTRQTPVSVTTEVTTMPAVLAKRKTADDERIELSIKAPPLANPIIAKPTMAVSRRVSSGATTKNIVQYKAAKTTPVALLSRSSLASVSGRAPRTRHLQNHVVGTMTATV